MHHTCLHKGQGPKVNVKDSRRVQNRSWGLWSRWILKPFQMIDLRKTGHGRHSDMTKRNGTRQHSQSYAMFSRPLTFRLVPSSLYFVELDKVNYADSACIILESIELCDYGDAGDHQVVRLTEVMYQGDA